MLGSITMQSAGGADYLNIFSFGDNWLIHRQIEKRGTKFFMRAKRRTI